MKRVWPVLVAAIALAWLPLPARADALQITDFEAGALTDSGSPATAAGSHPFEWLASFHVNTMELDGGAVVPAQNVSDFTLGPPPGMVAGAAEFPRCTQEQIEINPPWSACPPETQIGVARFEILSARGRQPILVPIYNLVPSSGAPAEFGFMILAVGVRVHVGIAADDYGPRVSIEDLSTAAPIFGASLSIWGDPGDGRHDASREITETPLPPGTVLPPFLTNPTSCDGLQRTSLSVRSYQDRGSPVVREAIAPAMQGCDEVPFDPAVAVTPSSVDPGTPTAFGVTVRNPPPGGDSSQRVASALQRIRMEFPPGVALSQAATDGLRACDDAQLRLGQDLPAVCPPASEVGEVTIETPLLDEPLVGGIFLGAQRSQDPESGKMVRLFLVAERSGLAIKVPGEVTVGAGDGRLTAVFPDLPPLPFGSVRLEFHGGPRAPIAAPPRCGAYKVEAVLTPMARPAAPVERSAELRVDRDCDAASRFDPSISAGLLDATAGGRSPFVFDLTNGAVGQNVDSLELDLPPGLTARVGKVPLCPGAAAERGDCDATSRIGSVTVGLGSGPVPTFLALGREDAGVYLAGGYRGAPYSLAIEIPVRAGPFELGKVHLRAALRVDPRTAQVTVSAADWPQIVSGIPVRYRRIHIELDRPGLIGSPTSCQPGETAATVVSAEGTVAHRTAPFRARRCRRLGFRPEMKLRILGATHRSGHPALRAVLRSRAGDSNLRRASFTLPPTESLDLRRLREVCSYAELAARRCPPATVFGHVRAWSPLLGRPLEGPLFLRESRSRLPGLAAVLDGPVQMIVGAGVSSAGGRIRIGFGRMPDVPVSRVVFTAPGGRSGFLVNNSSLCVDQIQLRARLEAQAGPVREIRRPVRTGCDSAGRPTLRGR